MAAKKLPKPKAINFELIPPKDGPSHDHTPEPYVILREVRNKWHDELGQANIALAWRKALKPDKDGHLILGKCVKASDLHRELAPYDFVILLNKSVWFETEFTREKKIALIDHELCHAGLVEDKEGFAKTDEKGRRIWRTKKHDIEEFRCIVQRHGCYKRDLELFAEALLKKREKSAELFPQTAEQAAALAVNKRSDRKSAGAN